MKREIKAILCTFLTAALLSGCGSETAVLSEMKTQKYVTLGEYKGLEVSIKKMEVTEELKKNYIDYILSRYPQWIQVTDDSKAEEGDIVDINFEGKLDGVAFEGGTGRKEDLQLGSGAFIEGFEEGLVGAGVGETLDLSLQFPDPYDNNPDLSGAPVVFTVTVNGIQKRNVLTELTDDYVKTLDVGCNTVEEYEAYVEELLETDAARTNEANLDEALIEKAMGNCSFKEPPKEMVDQYDDSIVRRLSKEAALNGVSLEILLVYGYGTNMEDFEKQAREDATETCKESIMLQAIANQEGITVSQEEIDEALQKRAESNGYESVEALKGDLNSPNYEDYAMCDKVMAFLQDNAVITEIE